MSDPSGELRQKRANHAKSENDEILAASDSIFKRPAMSCRVRSVCIARPHLGVRLVHEWINYGA